MQQDFTPIFSTRWDSSWPELAREDERICLFTYLESRFGIPACGFHDSLLFSFRQSWWLLKKGSTAPLPSGLKVNMVGMKAFQKVGAFIKPTTRFTQAFGSKATKSRVDLSGPQVQSLLRKGAMELEGGRGLEDGYVILCLGDYVLGLGLLIRGKLISQIPRKHLPYYGI